MWWHGPGMGLFGWGFMPGHGLLIALLLIFAVIAMTRRAQRRLPSAGMRSLDILEERYAKGEIQRDEYLQKKQDLIG